ncbi:MAG: DoxX family protein [Acidobacteria bacterium]|nr:DoxX family protein [Acidobacteriota bacterium]
MFNRILRTTDDHAILILRLTLGVVFFAHGAQKMLGWFGGYGFHGTMGFFTGAMHIPAAFAFLAIAAEFFGALGLITGLLGRVAAFGIFCVMLVAVVMVHGHVGFFMNWNGITPPAEGYEYHLLAMAMALAIMIKGSGAFSLDRMIAKD